MTVLRVLFRQIGRSGFIACLFLNFVAVYAFPSNAQTPQNIQIEVRFEEAGVARQGGLQNVRQSTSIQNLIVLEGYEGRIFIGRQIPQVTAIRRYLSEKGYVAEDIVFREVGTRLIVLPRIIGNEIEVTITPEISYQTPDDSGAIAVKGLSTVTRVRDGQSMTIGSFGRQSEFENNFYRRESGEKVEITLTPRILSF